jgi:peptidoglycan/xylan/chitin deacetylase (PgdA/CDA1 family)
MSGRVGTAIEVARRRARTRKAAPGGVVLGYHDIVAEPTNEPWSVTVDQFRAHLTVLRRLGLRVVDVNTIVDRLRNGESADGLAAITFDDALLGVYAHAFPLLRDSSVPATIFVVTAHLGVEPPWWPGVSRTMTADELSEVAAAGIRLESHSRSHRSLLSLDDDELHEEVAGSRADLAQLIGEPPDLIAYPSGHHDGRVREVVQRSGFAGGFTFLNGRVTGAEDPLRLPRLTAGRHLSPRRLAYQLRRSAASWPDHQLDVVGNDA